jgi:YVTN family beta-propeller protein
MQNDERIQSTITFLIILYYIALVSIISPTLTYAQKIQELHQLKKSTASSENAHIELGVKPWAIGVIRDRIYVISQSFNSTFVIEATNNTKIGAIKLQGQPWAIGVDEVRNRVYVADSHRTVSVIDGFTNAKLVHDIKVTGVAQDIAVDEAKNTVYVPNSDNGTVSIIAEYYDYIPLKFDLHNTRPSAIGINQATGTVYVANLENHTVSVLDSLLRKKYHTQPDIEVGHRPNAIGVNQATGRVYVSNALNDTVSVIDGRTNTKIGDDIKVGHFPVAIGINNVTNTIYVANFRNDTVSVIDGRTNTKIGDDIKVGHEPSSIGINQATGTVYVANSGSTTLSVIDGNANKLVAGVTFDVKPFNAGHIECYNDKVIAPTVQQFYLWSGSQCTAKPNEGFEFVSWQENLGRNSTQPLSVSPTSFFDSILDVLHLRPDKPESKLNITKFGSFTANFKALPPPIPSEYIATLFTVVATAFVGSWLTPTLMGWKKAKKEGQRVQTHHLGIKSLYDDGKVDEKDIPRLDKLKDDIMDDYAKGKISEQHYNNLNNTISVLYEEIYKKKIDLLNGKDLDKIKDEINDSYAKGKISEQHNLLNEKINKPSYIQERISTYQPQAISNDFAQSAKTYENSQLGIKMQYPAKWKLHQKEHYPDHPSDIWNQVIGFSSDREIHTNSENVAIYVKSLQDENKSADAYSYRRIDYIRKKFTIIETTPTIFAKSPGYRVLYTNKMGHDTIEVWTIHRNKVYTIKCTTKAQEHSLYLPIFEEIISSFQITEV